MSAETFLPTPITPEHRDDVAIQEARNQVAIEAGDALQRKITRQENRSLDEDKLPNRLDNVDVKHIGDVAIITAQLAHSSDYPMDLAA
ncbi:MAG TPA: hypothetical protein VFM68_01405 [Candidatus Saccharimonadales bacterium]|nr:hypothetical protein [Candidatus Saccharimonadales bacterium]